MDLKTFHELEEGNREDENSCEEWYSPPIM